MSVSGYALEIHAVTVLMLMGFAILFSLFLPSPEKWVTDRDYNTFFSFFPLPEICMGLIMMLRGEIYWMNIGEKTLINCHYFDVYKLCLSHFHFHTGFSLHSLKWNFLKVRDSPDMKAHNDELKVRGDRTWPIFRVNLHCVPTASDRRIREIYSVCLLISQPLLPLTVVDKERLLVG